MNGNHKPRLEQVVQVGVGADRQNVGYLTYTLAALCSVWFTSKISKF